MIRPLLLFASRHASVAAALEQNVKLFLPACKLPHQIGHIAFSSCVELFAALDGIAPEQLLETMLVFDISAEDESPWDVQNMEGEQGLAAQLVLSYPEIFFVFLETSLPRRGHSLDLERWLPLDYLPPQTKWLPLEDLPPDLKKLYERLRKDVCEHHYVPDGSLLTLIDLIQNHAHEFRVLFDATGLRSITMERVFGKSADERASIYRPLSKSRIEHVAVCAEDETSFIYLNGYVAYTAGFRTWLLSTQREFWRILRRKEPRKAASKPGSLSRLKSTVSRLVDFVLHSGIAPPRPYFGTIVSDLLSELKNTVSKLVDRAFRRSIAPPRPYFGTIVSDWELAYPDYTGPTPQGSLLLSVDLKANDELIVISSFPNPGEKNTWKEFHERPQIVRLPKPFGGIFKLLAKERFKKNNALKTRFRETRRNILKQKKAKIQSDSRHNAPYARGLIARRLLSRARLLKSSSNGTTELWVQMALLASIAKELLGEQSRTTAYEAIALQHEAEVNAEMSFFGISTKIEVKQRLKMLEREGWMVQGAKAHPRWKVRRESENSHLNFLLCTINLLRLRFIEYEQVKATEECVQEFSWYHRKLSSVSFTSFFQGVLESVIVHVLWVTRGYPEFATRAGTSVWRLFCLGVFWIAVFTGCYYGLLSRHPALSSQEKWGERIELAAWHSSFTFMSLQPGMKEVDGLTEPQSQKSAEPAWPWLELAKWSRTYRTLVLLELVIAYLHLGLFISILYRRITKRAP